MSQLQGYGFVSDSDESLKTKSGARFGGNFGVAFLTKFAYNTNVPSYPAGMKVHIEGYNGGAGKSQTLCPFRKKYQTTLPLSSA
jgi:hypothetical protein